MTIKDLAAQTGYAVGTVSRVLNHHPNVSEKAREAILKAVEESGYELNINAKQLKQHHSDSILVIVKGITNELFGEMVTATQPLVSQRRYPIIVDHLNGSTNEVQRAVRLFREKKPLGIIFLGGDWAHFRTDFDKIDVPCVLVTNEPLESPYPNLSSVCLDDRAAARRAVDTLLELGHRQIAIIGGDQSRSDTSRLRNEGCMKALAEHDIPFDRETDYQTAHFSYEGGYRAAENLLANKKPYTAILAVSDVMAVGAIRALTDHGLRVPEDVSVMGLDGLPIGSYFIPQLSTVSHPARQMARRSVEILLDAIENGSPAVSEVVPFTVHLRKSTQRITE